MKKTLLATSLAAAMGVAATADAAFTPMVDGNYQIRITSGCFDFDNCQADGTTAFADNTTANQADTSGFGTTPTYGSGILNDGLMGVINFTLASGTITSVTSYSQDSYLNTAGGTFYLRAADLTRMGGSINQTTGAMTFDPTGRLGLAAGYLTTLGEQNWNLDDTSNGLGTGDFVPWTTGTSTNRTQGFTSGFTLTGSDLVDAGASTWTGTLVSAGNIGQAWGGFDNQQYAEVFNVTILLVDPVANDDPFTTPVNTDKIINISDLLSNDTHTLGETLTLSSFTQPAGASTVVDNGDGTLTYSPATTLANGDTDSFTYIISDTTGRTSIPATVTVSITSNAAPTAVADNITVVEDTPRSYDPVANDTDPTNETLSLSSFDAFSANGGTIVAATGNTVTYTPAANNNGTDTFNYRVTDGINIVTGSVTVTITPVNDAPVCSDISLSTGVNLALEINVANDLLLTSGSNPSCVDVEGDAVSLAVFDTTGDQGGTLSSNGGGTLTYTPVKDFQGTEKFSFTATDAADSAAPNELVITVGALKSNFTMMDQTGLTFGGTNDVEFVWDEVSFNDITAVNANGIPTDTNFSIMQISSPFPFFNARWYAHNVRVFKNTTGAPVTLNFDISCNRSDYEDAVGTVDCGGTKYMTLTLQDGEIGAHILFDWGEEGKPTSCGLAACDIDVVNKWAENAVWNDPDGPTTGSNNLWTGAQGIAPATDTTWRLVSTDVNGDGINGTPMLDGPFIDNYANFNYKPAGAGESLPAYTDEIEPGPAPSITDAFSMELWSTLAGLFSVFGLRRINNKK